MQHSQLDAICQSMQSRLLKSLTCDCKPAEQAGRSASAAASASAARVVSPLRLSLAAEKKMTLMAGDILSASRETPQSRH